VVLLVVVVVDCQLVAHGSIKQLDANVCLLLTLTFAGECERGCVRIWSDDVGAVCGAAALRQHEPAEGETEAGAALHTAGQQ
jgi:hypothetical protein